MYSVFKRELFMIGTTMMLRLWQKAAQRVELMAAPASM